MIKTFFYVIRKSYVENIGILLYNIDNVKHIQLNEYLTSYEVT